MPQRKQVTWAQLRVGLLTLVGLFLIMVAILYVTGAGILRAKYQLRTFLPEVEGLTLGAPVRLDGVEVGNVDGIHVAPPAAPGGKVDRKRNVEVIMRVDRRFKDNITTESRASLVTEGFLGNRYVNITRGYSGSSIPPQGEVPGEEEVAMKDVVERGADLVENLGTLAKDVQSLIAGLRKGQGSLGKLMTDEQLYNHLNASATRLDQLLERTQAGNNSLGKLLASDEMYQRLNSMADRIDQVLSEIQEQKGTLGKLVYDPSLYQSAKEFVDKANAFITDVRAGKGTFGKLTTDEKLYDNLRDSAESLKEVTDKLTKGSGSIPKALDDPHLYDNLTSLSAELRLLIADIRKDPKKYLRIKLSIF
ncbi:MAG TPA: MlaD family protein [Candidatus Acidoferrales bacterium]|nr:MlaD family protein [Candidatus Acidoferrales bacterium]